VDVPISDPRKHKLLQRVVVDLTPVLPGGENGGTKVFVLELMRLLAEQNPQTHFLLLTEAASHEELAALDSSNVQRLMVLDHSKGQRPRSMAKVPFFRALAHLPGRLTRLASTFLRMAKELLFRALARLPRRLKRELRRLASTLLPPAKPEASRSMLQELNADLLFCPFTAPIYSEHHIPTVSVIYDLQYRIYPDFFASEDVAHRARNFNEAVSRSTALAAISDYSREAAIVEGKLDPDRIRTIHLRIPRDRLATSSRDQTIFGRLELKVRKYLIYPANFWKHKNHEMLLTAFGLARRSGLAEDIHLVCPGSPGERREWLMQAASRLGLQHRVLFPGFVTNSELLALLTGSSGVIFPSLCEGFGLPLIEAIAVRVPVACSNVTSLPEVAGDAAILFDPRVPEQIAAAIISLVNDKEQVARLVLAGDARAATFSDPERMAEQYWELFCYATTLDNPTEVQPSNRI
jgi:glycosyltransferase involved in cell wall biosynthesis